MMISYVYRAWREYSTHWAIVHYLGFGIGVEERVEIVPGSRQVSPGMPNGRPPELWSRGFLWTDLAGQFDLR